MATPDKRGESGATRTPGGPASGHGSKAGSSKRKATDDSVNRRAKKREETNVESPTPKEKRRKKRKSKGKKRDHESASESSSSSSDSEKETPKPHVTKRLQVPVLRGKDGTIRTLGGVRNVPCYECIKSLTTDSFAKYPNRCYDVKHETRFGMNSQCSTCTRKHVSPCNSVRITPVSVTFLTNVS